MTTLRESWDIFTSLIAVIFLQEDKLPAKPCSVSPGSSLTYGYNHCDFLYVTEHKDEKKKKKASVNVIWMQVTAHAEGSGPFCDQHVARHKSFSIIDIVQVVDTRLSEGGTHG